jgi:hypothetical protein
LLLFTGLLGTIVSVIWTKDVINLDLPPNFINDYIEAKDDQDEEDRDMELTDIDICLKANKVLNWMRYHKYLGWLTFVCGVLSITLYLTFIFWYSSNVFLRN